VADLIAFPAHALLILEERHGEQEAADVELPECMQRDELALRIPGNLGVGEAARKRIRL
jgi:hypothetical protein